MKTQKLAQILALAALPLAASCTSPLHSNNPASQALPEFSTEEQESLRLTANFLQCSLKVIDNLPPFLIFDPYDIAIEKCGADIPIQEKDLDSVLAQFGGRYGKNFEPMFEKFLENEDYSFQ